jgi:glycosyltransferase involved in cell wall biosynthesis
MKQPLVSVIVPTRNSASNLERLFESILASDYTPTEVVINDDLRSTDSTHELVDKFTARGLRIIYIRDNHSMAQGRKRGVDYSSGDILLHLDSDMVLSPRLISECVALISQGANALVIPEESFGSTFWAKCKWLEKKCYEGVEEMESCRCITRDAYIKLGGHNPDMVFSEDKDLDLRARAAGYYIHRTSNQLRHDEGMLTLSGTIKKKMGYSDTAHVFDRAHPHHYKWQRNIVNRYIIFAKNIKYIFPHPLLYTGLVFMKTSEYASAAYGILRNNMRRQHN